MCKKRVFVHVSTHVYIHTFVYMTHALFTCIYICITHLCIHTFEYICIEDMHIQNKCEYICIYIMHIYTHTHTSSLLCYLMSGHCNTLQHTIKHCNTLQHCNTLRPGALSHDCAPGWHALAENGIFCFKSIYIYIYIHIHIYLYI